MGDDLVGAILWFFQDIIRGVTSVGGGMEDELSTLLLSPSSYNSGIYSWVINIMENAVMPVANVLLALLFVLELYNVTIRTDMQGSNAFEIPFKTMFKIAVCKIFIESTPKILEAIFAISTQVITNMGNLVPGSPEQLTEIYDAISTQIGDMSFMLQMVTLIASFIMWLIFKFGMMVVSIMVLGRMMEIYVMIAISPLPLATIPNHELSSIAKNFLKTFAAVSIQGVLIYLVLSMYSAIIFDFGDVIGASSSPFEILLTFVGYALVLIVLITSTGKLSKSICNAM